jgi:hypothetical protein
MRLLSLSVIFAAVLSGCGAITNDDKSDFVMEGKNWVNQATTDLENRGHTYKANPQKTWRAVHAVLADMGVRVKDEQADWFVVTDTYPSSSPSGEVSAFIKDINSRFTKFQVAKARYRLSISCNPITPERTNVIFRVYWDVLKKGEREWESFNPNKRVIEYFYRHLDKQLPVFKDKSEMMWEGW